jgi:hypothetical protein
MQTFAEAAILLLSAYAVTSLKDKNALAINKLGVSQFKSLIAGSYSYISVWKQCERAYMTA